MNSFDFETKVTQALSIKAKLSTESELLLFAQAENLLSARRERISSRETVARLANRAKRQRLLAIHPDMPAAATTFIVLILAFIVLHSRPEITFRVSYSDLPDLPKTNDFPARYDAQLFAERQAYEREVEDAHKRTSGGI